jgi:hypothetical protein
MNYIDAIKQLAQGRKIRRKDWDKNVFLYKDNLVVKDSMGSPECEYISNILAEDWEVMPLEKDEIIQILREKAAENSELSNSHPDRELANFHAGKRSAYNDVINLISNRL